MFLAVLLLALQCGGMSQPACPIPQTVESQPDAPYKCVITGTSEGWWHVDGFRYGEKVKYIGARRSMDKAWKDCHEWMKQQEHPSKKSKK